jgi:hypothetical protein
MVANERVCYEHFSREIVWLETYLRLTRIPCFLCTI